MRLLAIMSKLGLMGIRIWRPARIAYVIFQSFLSFAVAAATALRTHWKTSSDRLLPAADQRFSLWTKRQHYLRLPIFIQNLSLFRQLPSDSSPDYEREKLRNSIGET